MLGLVGLRVGASDKIEKGVGVRMLGGRDLAQQFGELRSLVAQQGRLVEKIGFQSFLILQILHDALPVISRRSYLTRGLVNGRSQPDDPLPQAAGARAFFRRHLTQARGELRIRRLLRMVVQLPCKGA